VCLEIRRLLLIIKIPSDRSTHKAIDNQLHEAFQSRIDDFHGRRGASENEWAEQSEDSSFVEEVYPKPTGGEEKGGQGEWVC